MIKDRGLKETLDRLTPGSDLGTTSASTDADRPPGAVARVKPSIVVVADGETDQWRRYCACRLRHFSAIR